MPLMFGTWFGWWFIAFVLYVVALMVYAFRTQSTLSSWLVKEQGRSLSFRKPVALRRMGLLAIGAFALMSFPTLHQMVYPTVTARRHAANPQTQTVVRGYVLVDLLGLCLVFVYLSGPQETRLDGDQRTFENTAGWPWRPRSRTGSLDDLKGVCVSPRNNVLLLPRKPGKLTKGYQLSSTGTKQAAQALAEKVSQATGLPIVDYPRKS